MNPPKQNTLVHIHFYDRILLYIGKLVYAALRLRRHGGSTLPGFVVEKLGPARVKNILSLLPETVVVVTGTNGKTTTTKLISDVLNAMNVNVLTNDSGSNYTRGVIAQIIKVSSWRLGPLPQTVAVLELDEFYGAEFTRLTQPTHVVALNVLRDQLDRYGELDLAAKCIESIMRTATTGCVVNGNEPRLVAVAQTLKADVKYFGVHESLRTLFPTDDEFITIDHDFAAADQLPHEVQLVAIDEATARYQIDGQMFSVTLGLRGMYNFQNAAAAIALIRELLPEAAMSDILTAVSQVQPAFGRGETITVNDAPVELVLVKNPAGFQQALKSYHDDAAIMMAINDDYADGRDISWLWDVDFRLLETKKVAMVSGTRAHDLALRLTYDEISHDETIENLDTALQTFVNSSNTSKRIFCNYTAMLSIRSTISKRVSLKRLV